jgi:hypothetical protein
MGEASKKNDVSKSSGRDSYSHGRSLGKFVYPAMLCIGSYVQTDRHDDFSRAQVLQV